MTIKLEAALQRGIASVPECVAAGCVDLTTGMLLAIKTVDSHPREVLELLAAATADMYQGPNVVTIEKLFKKARGLKDDGRHYFNEMIVNSENMIHVLVRGKSDENNVIGFVCRRTANLGMVLSKVRSLVPEIEAAF